jgi:hypothetical protein
MTSRLPENDVEPPDMSIITPPNRIIEISLAGAEAMLSGRKMHSCSEQTNRGFGPVPDISGWYKL